MVCSAVKSPQKAMAKTTGQTSSAPKSPPVLLNPLWRQLAQRIQPRLSVSAPSDPSEKEADRIADRVMTMRPAEGPIHRSASSSAGPGSDPFPSELGQGQPLSPTVRRYFEPRFGRGFDEVRVHTDAASSRFAQALGAEAYALGTHVAFAPGNFQPSTVAGQRLIAHELAHVAQTGQPVGIRRKIGTDPQASLDGYFIQHHLTGVTHDMGFYSHAKGGANTLNQELLIDMLSSPRAFHVEGDTDAAAAASLDQHVKARQGIVSFASKKQYSFGAGISKFKMNAAYYDVDYSTGTWKRKPGVDKQDAWDDLNKNPQLYSIACDAATSITLAGGSGGAKIADVPSTDKDDWIAGEAGYIENTKFDGRVGLEGENLIYTGGGLFWGHFNSSNTYRSLSDWTKEVQSWNQAAKLDTKRELPATGLLV